MLKIGKSLIWNLTIKSSSYQKMYYLITSKRKFLFFIQNPPNYTFHRKIFFPWKLSRKKNTLCKKYFNLKEIQRLGIFYPLFSKPLWQLIWWQRCFPMSFNQVNTSYNLLLFNGRPGKLITLIELANQNLEKVWRL